MSPRAGIIAGKSVIVVQVQDSVDAALNKISAKLNKFSAKVNRLGFELFSGGFLGTLGLSSLGNQFKDFEDKLLFLSTKLTATDKELATVEKTIRSLGRTTSFTASQVADGATILAQAGFKANEVIKLLQPTLDLARGAQIDLTAAGSILANTIRSFSLETEKATEVASQFIAAARLGTLDVLDLKESIKEVLGTVRNLNIDLPTTLALITQLAERSLKGTKAGTSLNTALLQLASKGKQLSKLGISLPENIDGPGFIRFLEKLYEQINKMGNLKRTAVLQSIFNIRGGRAITALDDIKKIIELHKEISKAGDEARKAAVKMDSGFGGAIRRATSAIEGLTLRWGELLAKAIIPTLDLVPALSLALEQLTKANQTLVTGLLLSPIAILGLGAGLLTASFAAAKLAGFISLLAGGVKSSGRLIGGLLTQQLTNVAVLMDRIRKSSRGIDRGLSALLLTPQLTGGRGRNARKIKPTSFFGRVGKIRIPIGLVLSKTLGLSLKLIPTLGMLEAGFLGILGVMGKTSTAITKLNPPLTTLLRLFTSLSSIGLGLLLPGSNQLAKTTTFLTALNAIRSSVRSLIRQFGSLKKIDFFTVAMNASARLGRAIRFLTLDFTKLEGILGKSKTMNFLVSLSNFISNTKSSFAFGNLAKVLNPKPLLKLLALFKSSSLGKGFGKTYNVIRGTFAALIKGFQLLFKIDFVRIFFNGAKAVWSITKAFGALAAISFKTLTTLSGWGNILTFLLIFGPKIKFIREAFARLGAGISAAFRAIGAIGVAVGPAFTLIARSMKTLLAGDGSLGFDQLKTGLSAIVSIVGNQLSQAWDHVALAIAPAYDFMTKLISATFELGGLFARIFGASFGATFTNLKDLFAGGKLGNSMSDTLREIFDAIDLQGLFKGIGAFFTGIGTQLTNTFQGIYDVISNTMLSIQEAILSLFQALPVRFGAAGAAAMQGSLMSTGPGHVIGTGIAGTKWRMSQSSAIFDKARENIQNSFEAYINNLAEQFGKPTLTSSKIRELNLSFTESAVQQMLLDFANEGARKAEMQRVNKITSPNPTILGSLAVQDRRSPVAKLQEEMSKLRMKIAFNNSLPKNEAGFIPFSFHRKNVAMREKISELRARIKEELKAQRQMPISAPQRAMLSDIVSSTTGSFQQTRRNLVKLASGQSVEQKSLSALEQIQDNTSQTTGNLDQILQHGLPVTMGLK